MTEENTKVAEELDAVVPMKGEKTDGKDAEKEEKKDTDCQMADESHKIEIGRMQVSDSMDENIANMFNGQELSEDFKKKASVIFETVVASRVNAEIAKIEEEDNEAIDLKLAEAEQKTLASIDEYMENIVAEWAEENKIALETGIRQEIAEGFITDLKALFEKHNIAIPAEKVDMLEASDAENEVLREENKALVTKLQEQEAKIFEMEKTKVLESLSEGLAVTQTEKLNNLIKEVDAKSIETFTEKATILRDNMFAKTKTEEKTEKTVKQLNENEVLMNNVYASLRAKD
jgi:hypothetical protein